MSTLLSRILLYTRLAGLGFAFALVPARAADASNDDSLIAEMKGRMAAIQRQMLATDDMAERLRLQKEARKLLDETLARVSDGNRPLLEISLNIVGGLFDATGDYLRNASAFFQGPDADFSQLKDRGDIQNRINKLTSLIRTNEELIARINRMEADIEATLDRAKVSAAQKSAFMAGYQKGAGRKIGPQLAIRTLDRKIYEQWIALYHLLDEEWSHWKVDADGRLTLSSASASQKCDDIVAEIDRLGKLQAHAEQALLGQN